VTLALSKPMTLAQFLDLEDINESPAWEYINGEAIQKPMGGGKHSTLQKRLVMAIDGASRHSGEAECEAFPELRCSPNGRSVVPDVAIVQRHRLPLDADEEITDQGINFAPDWVI
jgi:Uma2 family endonuclease